LDTEHWRPYGAAAYPQPLRGQQTVTHDENFRRRFIQLVQREFAALAPRVEEVAAAQQWEALVVFGASESRDMFVAALSESWQKKVIETPERRFPTIDLRELGDAVAEAVASWRQKSDREELRALLESRGAGRG